MRALLLVAFVLVAPFACGSEDPSSPTDSGPADSGPAHSGLADSGPADSQPADSGPADSGPGDSGPALCPSTPTPLGVCPTGVRTCMYWAERTTCGTTYCPCAAAPSGTTACGSTGGCMTPTDNAKDCAPGGTCNENTGCVLQWCGRSCLCGADGKWTCNKADCP